MYPAKHLLINLLTYQGNNMKTLLKWILITLCSIVAMFVLSISDVDVEALEDESLYANTDTIAHITAQTTAHFGEDNTIPCRGK